MKIALIHDWLTGMRGGEKCLEVFCELFPQATIFTLIHKKGSVSPIIEQLEIRTSFLEKFPNVERNYRYYLPLMPQAIESFDLTGYDLLLSSSHCVAKGVLVPSGALHICYCHTPMRYIWEMYEEYFGRGRSRLLLRWAMSGLVGYLRRWDVKSSQRVNYFIANSENVRQRIKKHYNRQSEVIYPPVDTETFVPGEKTGDFFLMVTAFAPYKRDDLAIAAFNTLGYPLKIIGRGQQEKKLKKIAGSNIEFLGWQPEEKLKYYYATCRALIFPGEEDFGIIPLEAQAAGRPVIAYAQGGALETVIEGKTGLFFTQPNPSALVSLIKKFEQTRFDRPKIREHAWQFNRSIFKEKIKNYIENKVKQKIL